MGSRHGKKRAVHDKIPKATAGILPASREPPSGTSRHMAAGSITLAARKRVAKATASREKLGPDISNAGYWDFSYMPHIVTAIEGTSKAKLDMAALSEA
jgi:hypothetical protein